MNTKIAIVKNGFSLRGKRFRKYLVVKVWIVSGRWQIQPYGLDSKIMEALWYSLPDIHRCNLEILEGKSAALARAGIINNRFETPES
jgi:hypothetical protein